MNLAFREATLADFTAFYNALHARDRDNDNIRKIIAHEWKAFFDPLSTLSMLVEDLDCPSDCRIVGFAQTVFVSDAFVRYVRAGALPHINQRASEPLPDQS